jgi:hypothetical protein
MAGLESFVDGVRGALLTGSTLTLIGSVVAFFGLRRGGSAAAAVRPAYIGTASPPQRAAMHQAEQASQRADNL